MEKRNRLDNRPAMASLGANIEKKQAWQHRSDMETHSQKLTLKLQSPNRALSLTLLVLAI